jgi:hypothetical protein
MKKTMVCSLLCLPLLLAGCAHPHPYYGPPPPGAIAEIAHRGFDAGFRAGQRDRLSGLRPNPGRHPNFRRPPVPPPAMDDYRHAFQDGYGQGFNR